jgi:predicted GNAT family acetyltransferase
MAEKTIAKDPARSRYELRLEDRVVGVLDYTGDRGQISVTHTGVELAHRGQGLAAELVEFALSDARDCGLKVLPYCWYVRDYIAEHEEHRELVPAEARSRFGLA